MFRPNTTCTVYAGGTFNEHGVAKLGPARSEPIAVVHLIVRQKASPVRADSSGSHGAAQEKVADAVLLFRAQSTIKVDDVVEVRGVKLLVQSVQLRFSVLGVLDHREVALGAWNSK